MSTECQTRKHLNDWGLNEMKITLDFGVPYRDILKRREVIFETELVNPSIEDVLNAFMESEKKFASQVRLLSHIEKERLRAIYTVNGSIANYGRKINEGDVIAVLYPICGG